MDKACDVTSLENKRKCKQRFAFTVAMTTREKTLFTIFTLPKIHLVYPPKFYITIVCNFCWV